MGNKNRKTKSLSKMQNTPRCTKPNESREEAKEMSYLTSSERCVALFSGFAITTLAFFGIITSLCTTIEAGSHEIVFWLLFACSLFIIFLSVGIGIWRQGSDEY